MSPSGSGAASPKHPATIADEAVAHWLSPRSSTHFDFHSAPGASALTNSAVPTATASAPADKATSDMPAANGRPADSAPLYPPQAPADVNAAVDAECAAAPGKFAFLLQDRLLADTQLVLKRLQSKPGDHHHVPLLPLNGHDTPSLFDQLHDGPASTSIAAGDDLNVLEAFTVHSTVMCANSPYFRAKLLGGAQPGTAAMPSLGPDGSSLAPGPSFKVLEELLLPGDVVAMKSVLRFMYTEVLDYRHGVHSPASLITILRIADRFKVTDCVTACRREFSKLRVSDIDLDALRMVYSIDTIANDPSSFTDMMSAVHERLLEVFGDVVAVVRSPTLLFLTLPFGAVAALLRSDRLITDSENSVVVLASLWVMRSAAAQHCSAEQKKQLAGCIRLGLLSPSYLCGVLPNIRWFSFPREEAGPYFQALQARLTGSPEGRLLLQAQGQKAQQPFSPAGMSQPRSPHKDQNLELTLEIEEKSLAEYLRAGQQQLLAMGGGSSGDLVGAAAGAGGAGGAVSRGVQVNSETTFFAGYLFGIKLVFGRTSAAGAAVAAAAAPAGAAQGPGAAGNSSAGAGTAGTNAGTRAGGLFRAPSAKRGSSGAGEAGAAAVAAAAAAAMAGDISVSGGVAAAGETRFAVTPSVFAAIPPGEEALLPLSAPINVCFRCSLEVMGPYGTPFAAASFTGGSFMRPGDEAESSVAVSNFFRKVGPSLSDITSWQPFLSDGKLKLKLTLQGATLE